MSALANVFLAASDMPGTITRLMLPAFGDTARFATNGVTANWSDVARDLPLTQPDALVVEATLAGDPETLKQFLAALSGTIAIVVLPQEWATYEGQFQAIQSVRGVFIGPGVNWTAIASATYSAVQTANLQTQTAAPLQANFQQQTAAAAMGSSYVMGTRTIAFTSYTGGSGKSTIAEAVAVELARNHIRTLLCSFNSPAAAVGHFNLRFKPNAATWLARPNAEGFAASLQKVSGLNDLDVLLAPDDNKTLNEIAATRPMEAPDSVRSLVFAAYTGNYGAVILDLPPFADSAWALQPLLAANVVVTVCRPTRHDIMGAIFTYRLLTEQFKDHIRVPREAMFAVMNFTSPADNLSIRDFQATVTQQVGVCPPFLTTLPLTPKLPAVQNMGNSPMLETSCEEFAAGLRSLTTKLVGGGLKVGAGGPNGNSNGVKPTGSKNVLAGLFGGRK